MDRISGSSTSWKGGGEEDEIYSCIMRACPCWETDLSSARPVSVLDQYTSEEFVSGFSKLIELRLEMIMMCVIAPIRIGICSLSLCSSDRCRDCLFMVFVCGPLDPLSVGPASLTPCFPKLLCVYIFVPRICRYMVSVAVQKALSCIASMDS